MVTDCLRQPDSLPHAFAISRHSSQGGFGHADAFQGLMSEADGLAIVETMETQRVVDERKPCDPFWERVELCTVSNPTKQLLRSSGRNSKHGDASFSRMDQSRH